MVPVSQPQGQYVFSLEGSCPSIVGCTDSKDVEVNIESDFWPVVKPNTLKLSKLPVETEFSWEIDSGSGDFNIHKTLVKTELPALHTTTEIGSSPTTTFEESGFPLPGEVAYYRVYGRGSCTGESHP